MSGKTLKALLASAAERLRNSSTSPRLDAEILLRCVTGFSRKDLILYLDDGATEPEQMRFNRLIDRRAAGEPVAYITGVKEFFGIQIEVAPSVLIPRPETELLVEKGLEFLKGRAGKIDILDLGCGSGCITIALAAELMKEGRQFRIVSVDKSREALELAARNAARCALVSCTDFRCSDWFSAVQKGREYFDLIVSNPPYVAEGEEGLSPELSFEPHTALFAGPDGLSEIRKLLCGVQGYLKSGGSFLCEIGAMQQKSILGFIDSEPSLKEALAVTFFQDLAGHDRVMECSVVREAS